MQHSVRQATIDDADAACICLRRSIVECCEPDHHGDYAVLEQWLQNKTPQNLKEWLNLPRTYAVVAQCDRDIAGIAMLSESGTVALCYLTPEARFRGMGKAMLVALEEEARRRGLTELTLNSTRTSHEFYLRNGYADTGVVVAAHGLEAPEMRKVLAV